MKAAQIIGYGGPDVIRINDIPEPVPGENQVLVEVHAASINPFDIKVREGRVRSMAELNFPATLGGDVAGVVAAFGPNVTGFQLGEEVYGQAGALSGHGSFAEFSPVKAIQLATKPASIDFLQAAALPLVGASAYQALAEHAALQTGQKILIHGGAGGIGSIAVQLAKYLGAYVATTVGTDDIEFAKELGADEVIDYRNQDFTTLIKDYDAVFDTIGGVPNRKSYSVLKPGGALVSMADQPDDVLVKQYGIKYTAQSTRTTTERLMAVAELVDAGHLKVYLDKVFPLAQTAEAMEYQKTAHHRGKVVIQVRR